MTTKLEFLPEDIKVFNDERFSHPIPLVQRRMEALWLKSNDLPHAQIANIVDICDNTLTVYLQLYRDKGIDGLRTVYFNQPQSELCTHTTTLEKYFKEHPPATIKQAQHEIETITGIKRSETQVRAFLKKTLVEMPKNRNDASKSKSDRTREIS